MLKIAVELGPKAIYILGDYADFYMLNQHGPRDPRIIIDLQAEVTDVIAGLDKLDELFPVAKKHYIQGNHEWRLERYIQNRCPELYGYVTCQQLLKIEGRLGWVFHRYWPGQKVQVSGSKLWARHEPLASTAIATLKKGMANMTWGHTHRIDEARLRGLLEELRAFSCGWLGDENKDEVFGYVKGHYAWQKGFAVVWVNTETGDFHYEIIRISDEFKAFYQGKEFKG